MMFCARLIGIVEKFEGIGGVEAFHLFRLEQVGIDGGIYHPLGIAGNLIDLIDDVEHRAFNIKITWQR